jgi:uncharacterized membrane protein YeaQ/YmgE (transglycosylase-associated protein family)
MFSPAAVFVILLVIGVAAGLVFDRVGGHGWLSRQFSRDRGVVTNSLVGIAGSFAGFQLAAILHLTGYVPLLAAFMAAFAVLWGWRMLR